MDHNDRAFLSSLFHAAVAAAQPEPAVLRHLPPRPAGRTVVVGAGKASARMAQALDAAWDGPLAGLVVVPHGSGLACPRIEVLEAAHPVPDEAGLLAAERLMRVVAGLGPDDLVVALVSGGGSSLLPAPAPGLTLADEQAVNRPLLASGAPIAAMNVVRNQFSRIKGGRLAALAAPAPVVTLVISDVPGDDPALVASGPTLPIRGSREEARKLVAAYRITLPAPAAALLETEANLPPLISDPVFSRNRAAVIASAALSLDEAAAEARRQGVTPAILSDRIEGEARDVGKVLAALAWEVRLRARPFAPPIVLLSSGETTVTLRRQGRGGRNTEFLLALALALDGAEAISALAADTDGIDGTEGNAGAFADGGSVVRMRDAGADPMSALAGNDAYTAFAAAGDLFETGPTGTNVNDFRAILVR